MSPVEEWLISASKTAIVAIDALALIVIALGTIEAVVGMTRHLLFSSDNALERRDLWLRYARWLVAGLTFQLAADIIETSITTDWESVARLGIIAVVRTFLNFFLERDVEVRCGAEHVQQRPQGEAAAAILFEAEIDAHAIDARGKRIVREAPKVGRSEIAAELVVEIHAALLADFGGLASEAKILPLGGGGSETCELVR